MTPNPHEAARALGMSRAGDNSPGKAFLLATKAARMIVVTGERGGEPSCMPDAKEKLAKTHVRSGTGRTKNSKSGRQVDFSGGMGTTIASSNEN